MSLDDVKSAAIQRSIAAAAGVTLLKLLTAFTTGSLGMLGEAAHSAVDLMASLLTWQGLRIAAKPADNEHNYGHARFESLGAFAETLFMIGSAVWISVAAAHRIRRFAQGDEVQLHFAIAPIIVLLFSIWVDWNRSRSLGEAAVTAHSDALQAESMHFRTDIWSSVAALVGIGATYLGQSLHIRALQLADPFAALVVSGIIITVAWSLLRQTLDTLLDAIPAAQHQQAMAALKAGLADSAEIDRLRVRRAGGSYFADVSLRMPRTLSFQRSAEISRRATAALTGVLPNADVVVRTVPTAARDESTFDRVRAIAWRSGLAIHEVSLKQIEGGLMAELHLEVSEDLELREAHERGSRLEAEIRRDVPEIRQVITHLESEEGTIEQSQPVEDGSLLRHDLRDVAAEFPEVIDIHDVVAIRTGQQLEMSCHCTMPDRLHMGEVHRIITELEAAFLRRQPGVSHLLIHPEPATDNSR